MANDNDASRPRPLDVLVRFLQKNTGLGYRFGDDNNPAKDKDKMSIALLNAKAEIVHTIAIQVSNEVFLYLVAYYMDAKDVAVVSDLPEKFLARQSGRFAKYALNEVEGGNSLYQVEAEMDFPEEGVVELECCRMFLNRIAAMEDLLGFREADEKRVEEARRGKGFTDAKLG